MSLQNQQDLCEVKGMKDVLRMENECLPKQTNAYFVDTEEETKGKRKEDGLTRDVYKRQT